MVVVVVVAVVVDVVAFVVVVAIVVVFVVVVVFRALSFFPNLVAVNTGVINQYQQYFQAIIYYISMWTR